MPNSSGPLSMIRVLDAPHELGDVQFHAVWHPRVDEDPSYSWLRQLVRTVVATPSPPHRRVEIQSEALRQVVAVGTKIGGYPVLKSE